jgi:heme/copper-type cytochrome/quinol oxidase subunit 3
MMTTTHDTHLESQGHHEPPEVVDGRQRLAVWLFIGGDLVGLGALLFTYLYLRGTNTGSHWLSVTGYLSGGHSSDWFMDQINNNPNFPAPTLLHEATLSATLPWIIAAVVVASAALLWMGESQLRKGHKSQTFSSWAQLATLGIIAAAVLQVIQIRHVPQYFYSKNDSMLFVYTGYGSAILALGVSAIIHFIITALLGLGVSIRAARGVISSQSWFQARLVRFFFVWMAVSTVIITLVVTTFTTN